MLNYHNSQFTPDEICADFRRVLRERATSHSRFYHRLSTTSLAIRGLDERNNNGDGDQRNNIDLDTDYIEIVNRDNKDGIDGEKDKIDKNEILLANLSAQQPLSPVTGLSSTLSLLSSSPSPPLLCDYMPFVNHRPTKVNVNGIELVDRFNSSTTTMTSAGEVSPIISQFEALSSSPSVEKSLNCTSSSSSSTEIAAIARPRPPNEQVAHEADSSAGITVDGYLNCCRNRNYCGGESCDGDADDGAVNIRPAGDHISSCDSNKAKRKACVCEFVVDDVDNKSSHAINNNNKTCEQHSSDRSDYSTFVRTTSLDRAINSNSTRLRRCSCLSCCCCCSCTHRAGSAAEEFASELPPLTQNGSTRSSDSLSGEESGDRVIDDRSKSVTVCERQHQRVEELPFQQQYSDFPCVDKLVKMYTKLLQDKKSELKSSGMEDSSGIGAAGDKSKAICDVNECDIKLSEGLQISMNRTSPLSDEGCPLPGSPCSSDYEDSNETDLKKNKEKVLRSSSNDSALDLDDEPPMESPPPMLNTGRRMTLTVTDIPLRPALLPVAEPHSLPDSTQLVLEQQQSISGSASGPPTAIPSKVILEERIVEIPEDKVARSVSNSRRESAQSCLSDINPSECNSGVRYVRTPSVVVSDYSDDVLSCGVTLEEIEYFRAHRLRRRSSADTNLTEKDDVASDVSATSSCSNLDYCGSTISGLDGNEYFVNGERVPIDRKVSDCSTCSTVSGDDEDDAYVIRDEDYNNRSSLRKDSLTAEENKRPIKKVRHPKFIN